jgi:hypothetical protein
MLPVSLDCLFLTDSSVFSNVYCKANKAIVATLFPLRINFVNDFTRVDVLDLKFLLLLMTSTFIYTQDLYSAKII